MGAQDRWRHGWHHRAPKDGFTARPALPTPTGPTRNASRLTVDSTRDQPRGAPPSAGTHHSTAELAPGPCWAYHRRSPPLRPFHVRSASAAPRRWFVAGDFNGFFGLVVDNLSILGFIAMALVGIFQFPADVVFGRMFPGTAFGVLVGNLLYTLMARRLAARTGRDDVTAMPLGLDAPTSIGMALLVLGPAFIAFKQQGMDPHAAGIATWQLGMAALVIMGVLKFVLSFFGEAVTRALPRAALLGSIAGIALVLMGLLPLLETLRSPLVGFTTLGLLLYVLIAKGKLPVRGPGVLLAFVFGTVLYYGLGLAGLGAPGFHVPEWVPPQVVLPLPTLGFLDGLPTAMTYLPLLLPFGLLMVVGGINVSESARAAGDDYRTRDILLVEAVATLVAGICGGVAQTTPYIGQPAYKHMGAQRLHAADRPVRRYRRHAWHHLRAGAMAAAGGAGADHRVRGHRHHHPGLPGDAASPHRRDGVRFPAVGGLPAGDQGARLDRTGPAAAAADQA